MHCTLGSSCSQAAPPKLSTALTATYYTNCTGGCWLLEYKCTLMETGEQSSTSLLYIAVEKCVHCALCRDVDALMRDKAKQVFPPKALTGCSSGSKAYHCRPDHDDLLYCQRQQKSAVANLRFSRVLLLCQQ